MFGGLAPCLPAIYVHSNLYVIQKSSALTSVLNVTPFYNVVTGLFAIETIQGVDSVDAMTTGYAVAAKETENPTAHLSIWQITNPGTASPTLSGPTDVAVSPESGVLGGAGVISANNVASAHPARGMDDLDDRLDGFLAGPVALQLAGERDPADRLPAGLDHAVKAGAVGLGRGAADRVDDGVDLIPFAQRVECREGHADFGPQGADD